MNDAIKFAMEKGYVETLLGRKRYIREINREMPCSAVLPNVMQSMTHTGQRSRYDKNSYGKY